jgi:ATPase subunit of ABC transporter with duplicated ATPase domains
VVSHDRYLLERVTDHQMALLGDGKLRGLPGGVDQYLELREAALAAGTVGGQAAAAGATTAGAAAVPTGPSEAEKREARKDLNRIERQLGKLSQQEEKIHKDMAAKSESGDFDGLAELNSKLQAVLDEKEGLEMEWLEAAEVLGE